MVTCTPLFISELLQCQCLYIKEDIWGLTSAFQQCRHSLLHRNATETCNIGANSSSCLEELLPQPWIGKETVLCKCQWNITLVGAGYFGETYSSSPFPLQTSLSSRWTGFRGVHAVKGAGAALGTATTQCHLSPLSHDHGTQAASSQKTGPAIEGAAKNYQNHSQRIFFLSKNHRLRLWLSPKHPLLLQENGNGLFMTDSHSTQHEEETEQRRFYD